MKDTLTLDGQLRTSIDPLDRAPKRRAGFE